MRHSPDVWTLAAQALATQTPVALLYVVESRGSSPGRAGFALCVTAEATAGSIGGGAMEHRFIGEARQRLAEGSPPFLQRQVHSPEAVEDRSGMICSGEQTFWFQPLGPADRGPVDALAALQPPLAGVLGLDAGGLSFDPSGTRSQRHRFVGGAEWRYEEDLGRRDRLHIVGAGHCGLALSQLAVQLDFEVTVYDDRPGLPTFEANAFAHRKVVVPSYHAMGSILPEGDDQYVCVMTFGYKTDDVTLRSVMDREYRFLGALGSRHKIDQMFSAYTAEGIPADRLRRIHAPLGLPIHSQTPTEIAVSIAAQLIRERNQDFRSHP